MSRLINVCKGFARLVYGNRIPFLFSAGKKKAALKANERHHAFCFKLHITAPLFYVQSIHNLEEKCF